MAEGSHRNEKIQWFKSFLNCFFGCFCDDFFRRVRRENGKLTDGKFANGKFANGKFADGKFANGKFANGKFADGKFADSIEQ